MNHIKPNNDKYITHDSTDLPWVESPFFYDILERYRYRFRGSTSACPINEIF